MSLLTNKLSTWRVLVEKYLPEIPTFLNLDAFLDTEARKKVLIVHYDELPALCDDLLKVKWDLVVVDEGQRIKDRTSLGSRILAKFRHFPKRLLLSGTPIDKNFAQVWAQMRFAAPECFGTAWKDFEKEYMNVRQISLKGLRPNSVAWIQTIKRNMILRSQATFKEEKKKQFLDRLSRFAFRMGSEHLELPGVIEHFEAVCMDPKQALLYETMERDLVVTIKGRTIIAPMPMTLQTKLHQITGGFIFDEEGNPVKVGSAKLTWLHNALTKLEPPIVVFCRYRPELDEVEKLLKKLFITVERLDGTVKDTPKVKKRTQLLLRFQKGLIDGLACQVKTGGTGIDLFRSHNAVLFSRSFSFIDYDQVKKRFDRRGQKSVVHLFVPFVPDTIDEDITTAISEKKQVHDVLMERLRRRK